MITQFLNLLYDTGWSRKKLNGCNFHLVLYQESLKIYIHKLVYWNFLNSICDLCIFQLQTRFIFWLTRNQIFFTVFFYWATLLIVILNWTAYIFFSSLHLPYVNHWLNVCLLLSCQTNYFPSLTGLPWMHSPHCHWLAPASPLWLIRGTTSPCLQLLLDLQMGGTW